MADEDKKKQEEVEEEKEQVKQETVEDVVREVHEDTKDQETKEEEPKEEIKEETPQEEEKEPEIDAQEVADAAKEKGKQEIKQEVLKALGVSEQEKEKAEEAGYQTPWEKRGEERPKDWQEAIEAGAELAEFRREQVEKTRQEQQQQQLQQEQKTREELNSYWDNQLDELREAGKLPNISPEVKKKLDDGKPLNDQELQDPGLIAQRELFETMHSVGEQKKSAGEPIIYNLKEIYYEHYNNESNQPAGADAPISGGQKTPISTPSEEVTYEDVHSQDLESIIRGK